MGSQIVRHELVTKQQQQIIRECALPNPEGPSAAIIFFNIIILIVLSADHVKIMFLPLPNYFLLHRITLILVSW